MNSEAASGQRSAGSFQPSAFSGQSSANPVLPVHPVFNFQPATVSSPSSVFSGQKMSPNPVITIPTRPVNGSNIVFRPGSPSGKPMMTYSQFQKVQEVPEVKAAREAFMEAQKKYSETMKKAVEATAEGRSQTTVNSGQYSVNSGQLAAGGGQLPVNSGQSSVFSGQKMPGGGKLSTLNSQPSTKATPLTVQIPLSGSGTNGTAKTKL